MPKLTLYPVVSVDELVYPEQSPRYTLESRAMQFFTDFYTIEPLVIDSSVSAIEARNTMIKTHVRMKLVVDDATDKVLGAHMVGPDAGEIIQGLAVAIQAGATKAQFDATLGIHPTSAEEFVTMREPVKS